MFGPHANPAAMQRPTGWLDAYRAHNAAVRAHFASRPQQLLEFDPTRETSWSRLCAFLGAPYRSSLAARESDQAGRALAPLWRSCAAGSLRGDAPE